MIQALTKKKKNQNMFLIPATHNYKPNDRRAVSKSQVSVRVFILNWASVKTGVKCHRLVMAGFPAG